LLAQAAARNYEFGVRVALGASRWRIFNQMVSESLLLAVIGCMGGIVLARWSSLLLTSQLWTQTGPVTLELAIDWRVWVFTVAVTVATALIFGVAPAIRASRADPIEALNARGRTNSGRVSRLTAGAVVAQVALSITVLVAAGLFVRTFSTLMSRGRAFAPDGILVVRLEAPRNVSDPVRQLALYQHVRAAVRQLPGVAEATLSIVVPGGTTVFRSPVEVSDGIKIPPQQRVTAGNLISAGWFDVFSAAIVSGRAISEADRAGTLNVAVVNQAFARQFLGNADPLGHTIRPDIPMTPGNRPLEIVGVVGNAWYRRLRDPIEPIVYLPLAQLDPAFLSRGLGSMNLAVRTHAGSAATIAKSVTAAIRDVDGDLFFTVRPLNDQLAASIAEERVLALLSGSLAALGLLLAIVGLYGITSYATSQRRKEIAVRMALGATPKSVLGNVLMHALALVAVGMIAGFVLSFWASQFVVSMLVGVDSHDSWSLLGTAAIASGTGVLAGLVPAYRASRVEPARLLRES